MNAINVGSDAKRFYVPATYPNEGLLPGCMKGHPLLSQISYFVCISACIFTPPALA